MKLRDLVSNSTFMYLWTIYIFPGWICLVGCSKIGRTILRIYVKTTHRYMNVEIARQKIIILFGNNEAPQFHFWEYIDWNQIFILDSHRPFICSVTAVVKDSRHTKNKYNGKNMSSLMIWLCFFYFPNQISSWVPQVRQISVCLFIQNFYLRKSVFTSSIILTFSGWSVV